MVRGIRLVLGKGLNDATYNVTWFDENNKRVYCPFYRTWRDMLKRCYSKPHLIKNQSYIGCRVCDEWLLFSNFKKWMEQQDWQGKSLDKDLLVKGNKVYSPETCVFVSHEINCFILESAKSRGNWPVGVYFNKRLGKFHAQCKNPIEKTKCHIGYFDSPEEAHRAWKNKKYEMVKILLEGVSDQRVVNALLSRYVVDKL